MYKKQEEEREMESVMNKNLYYLATKVSILLIMLCLLSICSKSSVSTYKVYVQVAIQLFL